MPSMQGMPEQCQAMMQAMPQECMNAMQQMMQGGMMHGMMGTPNAGAAQATTGLSDFTTAYVDAMNAMHGPMMDGVMANDPDAAFVEGMIPHHQGAIDMAKTVIAFGKDPATKKLAEDIVVAQEKEIAAMKDGLKSKGK